MGNRRDIGMNQRIVIISHRCCERRERREELVKVNKIFDIHIIYCLNYFGV